MVRYTFDIKESESDQGLAKINGHEISVQRLDIVRMLLQGSDVYATI